MWLNTLGTDALLVLWFFLPAGIANLIPVFAAKLPILRNFDTPVDFGKMFNGSRLLGEHKTYRGFIVGTLIGGVVCWLQSLIVEPIFGSDIHPFVAGMLLGFGALFGDAVKSFFKRRIAIVPGSPWFPFDQLDYIFGAIIFSLLFVHLTVVQYCLAIVIWLALHIITVVMGYTLRIRTSII